MICNKSGIARNLLLFNRRGLLCRNVSNDLNIEKLESETAVDVGPMDEEVRLKEEKVQMSRNKSRLYPGHRNIVLGKNPYDEPHLWHHGTLKYLRKTYGRYGSASGVDPATCWPTKEELSDKKDYEKIAHPFTIPEMVAVGRKERAEKEEQIRLRQEGIVAKIAKLENWKQELYDKIAKKEQEATLAKQRKDRLIEEVRRHFGYTVDPRDEKFKEMLEKKEKEQKKALKEEKKKMKQAKMMERLLNKGATEQAKKEDEKGTKSTEEVKNAE